MWAFIFFCIAVIELGVILYLNKKGAIDRQKADQAFSDMVASLRTEIDRLRGKA